MKIGIREYYDDDGTLTASQPDPVPVDEYTERNGTRVYDYGFTFADTEALEIHITGLDPDVVGAQIAAQIHAVMSTAADWDTDTFQAIEAIFDANGRPFPNDDSDESDDSV